MLLLRIPLLLVLAVLLAVLAGRAPAGARAERPRLPVRIEPDAPGRDALFLHPVLDHETLGEIALRYRVRGGVAALARLNGLDDPDVIRAGGGILVPAHGRLTAGLARFRPAARPAGPLRACGAAAELPAPEPAELRDCVASSCSDAADGRRVCACAGPGGAGGAADGRAEMRVLDRDGAVSARWTSPLAFGNRTDSFLAYDADLDADGAPELVVATLAGTGCGLGVSSWTVAVLGRGAPAPILFEAGEVGAGLLVARDGPGCDLFATEWIDARDPRRGDGLYFAGRRFAYDGAAAALVPVRAEPLRARRFRGSFEGAGFDFPGGASIFGAPLVWLGGPETVWLDEEPEAAGVALLSRAGTVLGASRVPGDYEADTLALAVAFDDGLIAPVDPRAGHDFYDPAPFAYDRLGAWASGRGYPWAYVPAAPERLTGRRVHLVTYASAWSDVESVLWLE